MKEIKPESAEAWKPFSHTSALGNTGDYMSEVGIEKGKLKLFSSDEDIETEELQEICDKLNQSQPAAPIQGESVEEAAKKKYPMEMIGGGISKSDRQLQQNAFKAGAKWREEVPISTLKGVEGNEDFKNHSEYKMNDKIGSTHWFNTLMSHVLGIGQYLRSNADVNTDLSQAWGEKLYNIAKDMIEWRKLNSPVQGNVWVKELLDNCVQEQMQGRAYMKPGMRLDNKDLVAVYENAIYQFKERLSETPLTEDKQI